MEAPRVYNAPDVRQKIRYQRFEDPEVKTGLGDNSIDKVQLYIHSQIEFLVHTIFNLFSCIFIRLVRLLASVSFG